MKNKIAIASAFIAASSFSTAEIVINEFLSFEGFVDMSYSHANDDYDNGSESTNSYTLDQVEISWLFDFGPVSAQVDLQHEGDVLDENIVDQAFVTYDLGGGSAITAGRYDSMLGFEAFEPTGLYQYSTAYSSQTENGADVGFPSAADLILPQTNEGVKYTYENDNSFFGLSLQDGAFLGDDRLGGDTDFGGIAGIAIDISVELGIMTQAAADSFADDYDFSSYAVEAAFAHNFGNGFSGFIGAVYEDIDEAGDITAINAYVTYETGAWLFAAEYNNTNWDVIDIEIDSGLLMANYSYSDQASVTGRVSFIDAEDIVEVTKFTLAHNYAFTDNLLLVTELSAADYEFEGGLEGDTLEAAVELLFTF